MGYETELFKKIKGGTAAIKRGEKTPQEAGLGTFFMKLKTIDGVMYDSLMQEYKIVLSNLKK